MEDKRLKQRLIGAIVLVSLAVIFIPMLLKGPDSLDAPVFTSNIPAPPERKTEVIPLQPLPPAPDEAPITSLPVEDGTVDGTPEKEMPVVTLTPPVVEPPAPQPQPRPETKSDTTPLPSTKAPAELSGWDVQVGSFGSKANALALQERLRAKGFAAFVESYRSNEGVKYRVRVGPEASSDKAKAVADRLHREMGISGLVLRHK